MTRMLLHLDGLFMDYVGIWCSACRARHMAGNYILIAVTRRGRSAQENDVRFSTERSGAVHFAADAAPILVWGFGSVVRRTLLSRGHVPRRPARPRAGPCRVFGHYGTGVFKPLTRH